ncbi:MULTISPECIES: Rieske (2Fe-2S) protein [Streptomyces]|uniref:Rieske (2Fe-2S) protein n=1 Tax=Streptomyces TaxID=1883 RepID=UPI002E29EA49|nr:Rieske 2Fe-2S domain-containing protein [Streptomyces canus]
MSLTEWTKVATTDELPDGEIMGVEVGDLKICLARTGGKVYAINDICTHFATRLSTGELFEDELAVQCPLHDSKFSLLDGTPDEVPADDPVQVYAARLDGDNIVVGPAT